MSIVFCHGCVEDGAAKPDQRRPDLPQQPSRSPAISPRRQPQKFPRLGRRDGQVSAGCRFVGTVDAEIAAARTQRDVGRIVADQPIA